MLPTIDITGEFCVLALGEAPLRRDRRASNEVPMHLQPQAAQDSLNRITAGGCTGEVNVRALADILFRRSQRRAFFNCLKSLWRRSRYGLRPLPTAEAGAPITERHYAGAQTVPVNQILGSEGRAGDFDREFNPLTCCSQGRWLNVAVARLRDESLPPVELIQVGTIYYVRDGHHRISVAHALGEQYIDAEVTVWDASR